MLAGIFELLLLWRPVLGLHCAQFPGMMMSLVEVVVAVVAGGEQRQVGCRATLAEVSFGSIFSIRMVIMTEVGVLTELGDERAAISLVIGVRLASVMAVCGWAIAGSIRCCLLRRCPM